MKEKFIITCDYTIKQAMQQVNIAGSKSVFVIDSDNRLTGSVSDGDLRRAILNNISLDEKISQLMNTSPIYFFEDYKLEEVKKCFLTKKIEAIPVVDKNLLIVHILLWNDVFSEAKAEYKQLNLPVVIMAGGRGTRLDPFTRILPKPLIPIGDKPIIEIIIDEFVKYGIKNFHVSLNHKGDMIRAYFNENSNGYTFNFINENKPLGTAGALRFLDGEFDTPFFVSNCDIIIKEDYSQIYDFHVSGGYLLTIVVAMKHYVIPYGVCEIENGGTLKKIQEKPEYDLLINTGMYMLNPEAVRFIPPDKMFHITDLIVTLQKNNFKVGVFPISEKAYFDIGQWAEYKKTIEQLSIS